MATLTLVPAATMVCEATAAYTLEAARPAALAEKTALPVAPAQFVVADCTLLPYPSYPYVVVTHDCTLSGSTVSLFNSPFLAPSAEP